MIRLSLILVLLSLLVSCGPQPKQASEQRNLIPGELPDPSIIEVDGTYYMTGSSNDWGPIYPIYQSKDLKNWSFVTYVFAEKPSWTINSFSHRSRDMIEHIRYRWFAWFWVCTLYGECMLHPSH